MSEPFGRYQLLKRIAAGGMGEVFLARQEGIEGFEKVMVIKTLLPHLSEQKGFTAMFLDEARIAARLAHANVVQIFDLGTEQGVYYIAMEYVHGDELRKVWKQLQRHGEAFPVQLSVRIIADAASGLGYAHRLADAAGNRVGLVHRDVSPHNILVTFDGGVKLIDFGVAKAAGRLTNTAGGTLKGKYAYMSPEQVDGEEIDNRSDIFSLGIVLWEVLTGSRLFKRETDVQTMRAVSDCVIVPASVKNPAVPPELDPIVLKALAQDRSRRYQTMEDLRLDLENWLTSSHLSGSTAHLAAFMQREFAERLQQEGTLGALWDVDPHATGFSPLAGGRTRTKTSERSDTSIKSLVQGYGTDVDISMKSLPGAGKLPGDRPASSTPATAVQQTELRPHRRRRVTRWAWGATGAAALLGGAALLWPSTPPPTPLATPPVAATPKADPKPALPATAHVSVVSDPPGARIRDGDTTVGTTPAELVLPRSRAAINLTLELMGYQPVTRGVDLAAAPADHPVALSVKLEPDAPPAVEKPKAESPKPEAPRPHKKKVAEDEVKTFE